MNDWKPVPGFNGIYAVNKRCEVRRIKRGKRLMKEDVVEIRKRLRKGESLASIGRSFDTSYVTIRSIRDGKTWKGDPAFRVVKPIIGSDFYLYFLLCMDGKYRRFSGHRLVWEAFNGPIPNGVEINHKDLDRANNNLSNLELMTRSANINHALKSYGVKNFVGFQGGRYFQKPV